ncbi:MAG: 50S ribosomal protein L15 [bacterium]
MTTFLHTLPKRHGRTSRRVGRGHGSGRGTYAGRGLKGQRSRTGGRTGNIRRALMATMSKLPKQRGFRSTTPRWVGVNLALLEQAFSANETVTTSMLIERLHLSVARKRGVKILGKGKVTKPLRVHAHAFSQSAARAITKAGGSVVLVPHT